MRDEFRLRAESSSELASQSERFRLRARVQWRIQSEAPGVESAGTVREE
jgi:hypothetical protein